MLDSNVVSRFINDKKKIYSEKPQAKPSAFCPTCKTAPNEISVFHIDNLSNSTIWQIADNNNLKSIAKADMNVGDIRKINDQQGSFLNVFSSTPPPFHANIKNIISDRAKQKAVALQLSNISRVTFR